MIDWQTQFLTLVLIITKDPGSKPPRTLSELYGPDPNRTLLFHHDRYCEPTCSRRSCFRTALTNARPSWIEMVSGFSAQISLPAWQDVRWIYAKLHVNTLAGAVVWAIRDGIV